ncbi:MAG: hypothetical protein AAF430_03325 [Myxococcota bacterium]
MIGALTALGMWLAPAGVRALPVDLEDPRPRAIEVRFENSAADAPGRLQASWGPPVKAWLSPGAEPGQVEIRISGAAMEGVLAAEDPVPGSFGEFRWVIDVVSGEVVSALLEGILERSTGLGAWSPRVEASIEIDLATGRAAGYMPMEERWGHALYPHCDGSEPNCTRVAPRPYDRASGYVNAVGWVRARSLGWMEFTSYCPLGEVRFDEVADPPPAVSSGPAPGTPAP